MEFSGQADCLKIAYIGGGSRGWAWGFMADLLREPSLSGQLHLYDIDHEAARRNVKLGARMALHPNARSKWEFFHSETLQSALENADFVVISILPGTFAEMASDVHTPERLGIYQSVGDTAGPGGLVRALRTVPMMTEIGNAIGTYAPQAFVVNYTNPMALCLRALYEAFPDIRAFGCCHEVFSTQKLLCMMLDEGGYPAVRRQDIHCNVMGLNHFTWINEASWGGLDLLPLYRRFAEKYLDSGVGLPGDKDWREDHFKSRQRVKLDLFLQTGVIAAAGDRHLAEFMPPVYLKNPDTAAQWCFSLTPVSWRVEDLEQKRRRQDRLLSGEEQHPLEGSGEEGVLQLKALLGLGEMVTNVNLPNKGQMEGLPHGVVVETNALFRRNSLRPLCAGALPAPVAALTKPHAENQSGILRAALDCDFDRALDCLLREPLVTCSEGDARELLRDMIRATMAYLPEKWNRVVG